MLPRAALRCKLVQSTGGIVSPAGIFRGDRIKISVEFVGREEILSPLKTPAGEATGGTDCTRAQTLVIIY